MKTCSGRADVFDCCLQFEQHMDSGDVTNDCCQHHLKLTVPAAETTGAEPILHHESGARLEGIPPTKPIPAPRKGMTCTHQAPYCCGKPAVARLVWVGPDGVGHSDAPAFCARHDTGKSPAADWWRWESLLPAGPREDQA